MYLQGGGEGYQLNSDGESVNKRPAEGVGVVGDTSTEFIIEFQVRF